MPAVLDSYRICPITSLVQTNVGSRIHAGGHTLIVEIDAWSQFIARSLPNHTHLQRGLLFYSGIVKRTAYDILLTLRAVEHAEKTSKEAAARQSSVDAKRIREWCSQKDQLLYGTCPTTQPSLRLTT